MYKLLGTTDETTTCECCGKRNLKSVVVLQMVDGGEIVRYGSMCASKALRKAGHNVSKSALDSDIAAVTLANEWLEAGHSLEVIGRGIGNRFGYCWQVRDNVLAIGGGYKGSQPFAYISKPAEYDHVACMIAAGWLAA